MAKNHIKVSAKVVDTVRPEVAGVGKRPALHRLRRFAERITTPLLPDDYLHLINPLWSARELRGRVLEVRRETEDSATLIIKPGWGLASTISRGSTSASGCRSTAVGGGGPTR